MLYLTIAKYLISGHVDRSPFWLKSQDLLHDLRKSDGKAAPNGSKASFVESRTTLTSRSGTLLEFKKGLKSFFTFPTTYFHFQNGFRNELLSSKCGSFSKCVFIFKMWTVWWVLFFLFAKNTIVNKNLHIHYKYIALLMRL